MKAFCLVALGLTLVACHPKHAAKKSAEPSREASISASPNPIPAGPALGETTVTWDTGSKRSGQVYVSRSGQAEELFASGKTGAKAVKWIQARRSYEFRLYEGTAHTKLLAKVEVTYPR